MRVKVTFHLKKPYNKVFLNDKVPFDGILSYFAYKRNLEKYPKEEAIERACDDLPLVKKHITADLFFYISSIPSFEVLGEISHDFVRFTSKPEDLKHLLKPKQLTKVLSKSAFKIGYSGSNCYKNMVLEFKGVVTDEIHYVVEVQDSRVDEFMALLNSIDHVGKFSRYGFGTVEKVTCNETDEPIIRYLPIDYFNTKESYAYIPLIPPYWKKEVYLCGLSEI